MDKSWRIVERMNIVYKKHNIWYMAKFQSQNRIFACAFNNVQIKNIDDVENIDKYVPIVANEWLADYFNRNKMENVWRLEEDA